MNRFIPRLPHLLPIAFGVLLLATALPAAPARKSYDIPADSAWAMLKQFTLQSGEQLLYSADSIAAVNLNPIKGTFTAREALQRMVEATPLTVVADRRNGALTLVRTAPPNAPRAVAEDSGRPEDRAKVEDGVVKLDAFEVMGGKVLNMDVARTRDDAQPYVIFNRASIEQSGAITVEDFLRQRLPQEATQSPESQINSNIGPRSQINLRGLGQNQTLVLVDGRRVSGASFAGTPLQADVNGIPLSAIERIEVLPTTASGIYGGSATGGVVNIVLRRDYAGAEVRATYDNSFDTDSALRRVDLSFGFTLEGGRTNVLLAASWSKQNMLLTQDRDFIANGMNQLLANHPGYFNTGSAILGATTNIRSTNGTNLVLKPQYGGKALSSSRTFVPYGYTGVASDNGAALVANAGKYNFDQPNSLQSRGKRSSLLAGPERQSIMGTVRRQFTPWLQAFAEFQSSRTLNYFPFSGATGLYNLPTTVATNPFTTTVQVAVPLAGGDLGLRSESRQMRAAGGVIVTLPHDWKATVDYSRDESTFRNALSAAIAGSPDNAAMQAGTLNPFRDVNLFPIDLAQYYAPRVGENDQRTTAYTAAVRASGPFWNLPAGAPTVSTLIEHRGDIYHRSIYLGGSIYPKRSQYVNSGYLEMKVPLISAAMQVPLMQELELQLAGRTDRYNITGTNFGAEATLRSTKRILSSEDPTVGLRWRVTPSVMLRGSYGTGYLPPAVNQLTPDSFTSRPILSSLPDPKRGNELVTYIMLSGGNPGLRPELSETYSTGLVLTPEFLPNFRLSADWNRIEKRDNIANTGASLLLLYEDLMPAGTIIRSTPAAGDPFPVGPVQFINTAPVNFARAMVESYDFQLDYSHETATAGRFDFFATATRTMHYRTQATPIAPVLENVGYTSLGSAANVTSVVVYPMKWRANFNLTWRKGPWSLGWATRYIHHHSHNPATSAVETILGQGNGGRIDAQIFHDVFAGYRFGPNAGAHGQGWQGVTARLLRRTEIQVGVRNVFNSDPAFNAAVLGRLYSTFGDPRLASYYINLKKAF